MSINSLVERYFAHEEGKSSVKESTLQHRRSHLKSFIEWSEDYNDDLTDLNAFGIEEHLSWMGREEYSDKYIRARWWAVKSLYEYLNKSGVSDVQLDQVDYKSYGSTQPKRNTFTESTDEHIYLSWEEVETLAANVPSSKLRNELIVLLLFETGVRGSELANMKVENIDHEEKTILIKSLKKRKRDEFRTVRWWSDSVSQLLTQWLDRGYRMGYAQAADSPYLFPTTKRDKIRHQEINEIVKVAADEAGLQEEQYTDHAGRTQWKITAHTLRHSCCVHLLNNGVPVTHVQKLLGHSKLEITQLYAGASDDDIGKSIERMAAHLD